MGLMLRVGMEVIINFFGDSFAYASDTLELAEPGPRNRSRRTEMMQQRLLAAGADAGNFVERRAPQGL